MTLGKGLASGFSSKVWGRGGKLGLSKAGRADGAEPVGAPGDAP